MVFTHDFDLVNGIVLATLRSWKSFIIDARIVFVLKQRELGLDITASLDTSTVVQLVHYQLIAQFGHQYVKNGDIDCRLNALQADGVLSAHNREHGTFRLCNWVVSPKINENAPNSDPIDVGYSKSTSDRFRKKIRYLGDRCTISSYSWLQSVLLDTNSICDAIQASDPHASIICSTGATSLAASFQAHSRCMAASLGDSILLGCTSLFQEVLLHCSVDPLTEVGVMDFLCSLGSVGVPADPLSPRSRESFLSEVRSTLTTNATEESIPSDDAMRGNSNFSGLWTQSFCVDRQQVHSMHEKIPHLSNLPFDLGKALLEKAALRCSNACDLSAQAVYSDNNFHFVVRPELKHSISYRGGFRIENRLKSFYEIYAPQKVPMIPALLELYKFKKHKLVQHMHLKYHRKYLKHTRDCSNISCITFADFFVALLDIIEKSRPHSEYALVGNLADSEIVSHYSEDIYWEDIIGEYVQILVSTLRNWSILKPDCELHQSEEDQIVNTYILQFFLSNVSDSK